MKRQSLNQLTQDNFDDDNSDEDTTSAGEVQKASAEEMSKRKIFRASRPTGASGDKPTMGTTFSWPTMPGPAATSTTTSLSSLNKTSEMSNPFSGFSGLTSGPSKQSNNITSMPASLTTASSSSDSEFSKKMKKLNSSFLQWAERQIKENAIAIWKDGVKDYIQHQKGIREKYGSANNTLNLPVVGSEVGLTQHSLPAPPVAESKPTAVSISLPPKAFQPPTSTPAVTAPFGFNTNGSSLLASSQQPSSTSTPAAPFVFGANGSSLSASNQQPPSTFSFNLAPPATTASATVNSSIKAETFSKPSGFSNTSFSSTAQPTLPSLVGAGTFTIPTIKQSTDADDDEEGGDVDEAMKDEAEKVLRNDIDKDEIMIEANCKLFTFNKGNNEWGDAGKGIFRITKDPSTDKKRMLIRNGTGRIIFNASFYAGMKVDRVKGGIRFSAFVTNIHNEVELKNFMVKMKDQDAEQSQSTMERVIKSL